MIPCFVYFSQNPYEVIFTDVYSWDYEISEGKNIIYFNQPVQVQSGQIIILTQNTGSVAIDSTSNGAYSDLVWQSPFWNKLSSTSNFRFFLKALTNFTAYQSSFQVIHYYQNIGTFNFSITFLNTNYTISNELTISGGKIFLILQI